MAQASWENLPQHLFSEIMTILALESIKILPECNHVCPEWNVMISQMTKLKKDTIRRKAEVLADKIKIKTRQQDQDQDQPQPQLTQDEIVNASCLAHHRMLEEFEIEQIVLHDGVDLDIVPERYLKALTSRVNSKIDIANATVSLLTLNTVLSSICVRTRQQCLFCWRQ